MDATTTDPTLIGLIATMIATLVWVVRSSQARADATLARTDALMTSRDKHIETALGSIESALVALRESTEAVRKIEQGQHETRGEMISDVRAIAASQVKILEIQERILRELERMESARVE